ncbi:MAG TPA: PAS domain S-box protein [Thermoanaerobaculia bacterium]|nr:PAS domain S-box protein [Thermoanaerobaculia bacterium]
MVDRNVLVLLIDDGPLGSAGVLRIRQALGGAASARLEVEPAAGFEAGLARLRHGGFDAVLLALDLTRAGAIEAIELLAREGQDVPVLALSDNGDVSLVLAALEAGAQDLVSADAGGAVLARAILGATTRRHATAVRLADGLLRAVVAGLGKELGPATAHATSESRESRAADGDGLQGLVFRLARERARVEAELRARYESFHLILEAAPLAIVTADPQLRVTRWNRAATQLFGWSKEEVLGTLYPLVPEDRQEESRALLGRYAAQERIVDFETRRLRKDGSLVDVSICGAAVRDARGEIVELICMFADITERRQAAEALRLDIERRERVEAELRGSREKLRGLSARLLRVREEERTRIAREIHDELGQSLTGLALQLSALAARVPPGLDEVRGQLQSLLTLANETQGTVREIAAKLRPTVLDSEGLDAAVEWLVADFRARTGIPCELALRRQSIAAGSELSTALFRILQEALTNVARHAGASRVEASLAAEGGQAVLEVRDDGRGIAAEEASFDHSLGLLGMDERARALGGRIEIHGEAGRGTTLRASIPLRRHGEPGEEKGLS